MRNSSRFFRNTIALKNASIPILLFAVVALTSALVSAQTSHLEGVIKARSGMQAGVAETKRQTSQNQAARARVKAVFEEE